VTPLRMENTVICSFHFIKRNLRSTTAIINTKLFPTLYQRNRARDIGPIGIFSIRPLGPCLTRVNCEKILHVAKNATLEKLPQFQFKTEMHQIRLRLGCAHTPLGELKALPRPLAVFKGSYLGGTGREKEEEREVRGGKRHGWPPF